jgi:exoribonuclease II
MKKVLISDDVALLLNDITEREHISVEDLIERLVKSYKTEIAKRDELKAFFRPYQKNISGFKFNREEANER